MVDQREAALTFARIRQLHRDPVQGQYDVAHLREVHRRIFQDLPHHGPGDFRPEASGHFKHRLLESTRDRTVVPYALRSETDRQLGPTLDALQGGRALAGFDLLEMSEAIAQTYARLDYLHPFREGNSRTLRSFTEQLARDNGHRLDWNTTNVTPEDRDALYIARDMAVIQLRYPGLTPDSMMTVDDRHEYEMAFQLHSYRLHDPLHELVRRSLERGRDAAPYERRMSVAETVREIAAVAPVALTQAERAAEASRLAVLRHKAPVADHETASDLRDWVAREGNMAALTDRLELVAGGHISIRHEPGAPALDRLRAVADGIGRELAQQRAVAPVMRPTGRDDIER
ncbi:Fic family protein [Sphingomonas sp.]|uniref:Fic family protein n=1 Tax=Sphingomonas sp. TaxID=28214 RepID=UPI0025D8ADD0|nr:Fic family protein [Sphingomonas sp.]